MIEFLQVPDGALVVLSCPSQAASGPGWWSSAAAIFEAGFRKVAVLEVFDIFLDELGGVEGLGAAGLPREARRGAVRAQVSSGWKASVFSRGKRAV